MNWLSRMIAVLGRAARQDEERRDRRVKRRLAEADPVIREYKRLDGALEIYVRRAR